MKLLASGVGDRAGKVLVDAETLRVVAYCPSPADAVAVVNTIDAADLDRQRAVEERRHFEKIAKVWEDEDSDPRKWAKRKRALTELLLDLYRWQLDVPEPLPVGLRERLVSALNGKLRRAEIDAKKPLALECVT